MFFGLIVENYVACCLAYNEIPLLYWESNNTAEIDFIIQQEMDIIPIEVKKSFDLKSRSLNTYLTKYPKAGCYKGISKEF